MFRDRVWAVLLVILDEVEVCPHLHFALLPLTGVKKGRTPFKRLAVPKMRGRSAS